MLVKDKKVKKERKNSINNLNLKEDDDEAKENHSLVNGEGSSSKKKFVKLENKKKLENDIEENQIKRKLSESREERSEIQSFGICSDIEKKLKEKGITKLFEVQQKVFFPVFNGENTIVASLTGSGKTLSFILPILESCKQKDRFTHKEPVVIVMAPTRELAIQIAGEFNSLSAKNSKEGFHYKVSIIYGGDSIEDQKQSLRRGTDIVVGTPGRIIDMINKKELKLSSIRFAVLDEADKMLDMGFQESIEEVFDKIYEERKKIQVCLFSATIHKWVIETAKKIMRNNDHTFVNLVQNLQGRCPVGVEHLAVNCLKSEKITTIADLSKFNYHIIF